MPDLDAVLDCEEDLGVTVDGEAIRDPAGPEGLPFVGSYYEVFPDHLVSLLLPTLSAYLTSRLLGKSCSLVPKVWICYQV